MATARTPLLENKSKPNWRRSASESRLLSPRTLEDFVSAMDRESVNKSINSKPEDPLPGKLLGEWAAVIAGHFVVSCKTRFLPDHNLDTSYQVTRHFVPGHKALRTK